LWMKHYLTWGRSQTPDLGSMWSTTLTVPFECGEACVHVHPGVHIHKQLNILNHQTLNYPNVNNASQLHNLFAVNLTLSIFRWTFCPIFMDKSNNTPHSGLLIHLKFLLYNNLLNSQFCWWSQHDKSLRAHH
jgi:hypothetical protein